MRAKPRSHIDIWQFECNISTQTSAVLLANMGWGTRDGAEYPQNDEFEIGISLYAPYAGSKSQSDKVGFISYVWIRITHDYNTMPKSGVKSATIDRHRHRWRARAYQISWQEGGFSEYDEIFNPPEIHRIVKSEYLARLTRRILIQLQNLHAPAP